MQLSGRRTSECITYVGKVSATTHGTMDDVRYTDNETSIRSVHSIINVLIYGKLARTSYMSRYSSVKKTYF